MSNPYLEPSSNASDRREIVGRDPRKISLEDLRGLDTPQSPIKSIRAYCVECAGDSEAEARKCPATQCPLWPFRMGKNVFHTRRSSDKGGADA